MWENLMQTLAINIAIEMSYHEMAAIKVISDNQLKSLEY